MGLFYNPGNQNFSTKRNDDYVDKSEMISVVNATIWKRNKLSCISRPRRFGKSYAAAMLAAYYDKSCDSAPLFDGLEIASDAGYQTHLNKYNVMYLDMTYFMSRVRGKADLTEYIEKRLETELADMYPGWFSADMDVTQMMEAVVEKDGAPYIAIIDEWDAPIRSEKATEDEKHDYLEFLRGFFKNATITDKVFAGAYMTGILPIKKDGSQSAISEFREYTILRPRMFAPFIGFTEKEVEGICERRGLDFAEMKRWYDGYELPGAGSMYNASSVMQAAANRSYESYWQTSSAADSLLHYLNMDFDGLGKDVDALLRGRPVRLHWTEFGNDMAQLDGRDDVLTLLTHFGYLSYDEESGYAQIPNREVRMEFYNLSRKVRHAETMERIADCDRLFAATAARDADAVAAGIQKVHEAECSPLHYNREDSLRSVIKLAYYTYRDEYLRLEEAGGGTGYADIVYIPRKYSDMPLLIVELKKDDTPENAVAQIRERGYATPYENGDYEILLVGIAYDSKDPEKKHSCVIEDYRGE